MSRIVFSHSITDNLAAVALSDWLKSEGWQDVFLDLDPARRERWAHALYERAAECEAVLFLVSRNWLASDRRRQEYETARRLGKNVFIVLIEDLPLQELPEYLKDAHQPVRLGAGADGATFRAKVPVTNAEGEVSFSSEGLADLRARLSRAALDPRSFAWPPEEEPDRAPYRGLEPLESEDAGVFFGRDASIIETLDALRRLREAGTPRLFAILGASGAGKSSFLRAGLLPRLRRDEDSFLPLPLISAKRAAITGDNGLVAALATAATKVGLETSRAQIREAAEGGAKMLRPILQAIVARREAKPTLIFTVDDGEELLGARSSEEGRRLLQILGELAATGDPAFIIVFAIRSDFCEALAQVKPLQDVQRHLFMLPAMTRDGYRAAIERPAQRLAQAGRAFEIEPDLTQAALDDAQKLESDSLPLLAFTLEQLYRVCGAAKRVARADYEKFGGLSGSIYGALGRAFAAADSDPRIPKAHEARLMLLRRGLIPWLASVDNETRIARGRQSLMRRVPEEARPLIELLAQQRLLRMSVDPDTGEAAAEPAHDALLRQWKTLKGWLDEEFEWLARLEGVKRAAREWEARGRADKWAMHNGHLLEEAEHLYARPDFTAQLGTTDRAYLAACMAKQKVARGEEEAKRRAEDEQERKKTRTFSGRARRAVLVSWISLTAALALGGLAGWQWQIATKAKTEAEAQRDVAEKGLTRVAEAANRAAVDLTKKLDRVSDVPTSVRAEILNRARQLQEDLIANGVTSKELQRGQSVVLNGVAQTYLAMGDGKSALTAARQSAALMEALSASDPGNAGWRRDLSVSYETIGDAQKAQGDLAAALKAYRADLAIAEALSSSDPGNAQWRWDLSISLERVGDVLQVQGDLDGALKSYRDSAAIREAMSKLDPSNVQWRRELAVSDERIGATLAKQKDAKGAIAAFERALGVYQALLRARPDDDQSLVFSVIPHWRLAELDKAGERGHLEAALGILESLAATNRLDSKRRGWLAQIKAQILALDQSLPAQQAPYAGPAREKP
jgi:tetratricopeptide (TPR) repeat protein